MFTNRVLSLFVERPGYEALFDQLETRDSVLVIRFNDLHLYLFHSLVEPLVNKLSTLVQTRRAGSSMLLLIINKSDFICQASTSR